MRRSLTSLCCMVLALFFMSMPAFSQSNVVDYNGVPIEANSIIVHIDPAKTLPTTARKLTQLKQTMGALTTKSIDKFNIEAWNVSGDMTKTLEQLNQLPGIKAFPNYAFSREEMTIKPLEKQLGFVEFEQALSKTSSKGINLMTPFIKSVDGSYPIILSEDFSDSASVAAQWTSFFYADSGSVWAPSSMDGGYLGHSFVVSDSAAFKLAGRDSLEFNTTSIGGFDFSSIDPNAVNTMRINFENPNAYPFFMNVYDSTGMYFGQFDFTNFQGGAQINLTQLLAFLGPKLMFGFNQVIPANTYEVGETYEFAKVTYYDLIQAPTNDPLFGDQYALNNDGSFQPGYSVPGADIDAVRAWDVTQGSEDVIIAIYDDGVDFSHPDLAPNRWVNPGEDLNGNGMIDPEEQNGIDDDGNGYADDFWGWSPVYGTNDFLNPGSFHGTHVAGIVGAAGNNGEGISGVAQNVKLINVMIFNEFGGTNALAIMEGYHYLSTLLDGGVDITAINQSWGGGNFMLDPNAPNYLSVMTGFARHHNEYGTVWVISAGNASSDRDNLPFYSFPNNVASPNIITVASTDDADNMSGFSDFGMATVDVGAPGSNILSTLPPSTMGRAYGLLSGTSMAAPQVAGAIALAKSLHPDQKGVDLAVSVLAGAEDVAGHPYNESTRLNAYHMVDVSAYDDGLPTSHETARIRKTFLDDMGVVNVGFVNGTQNEVTVTGASLSGGEQSALSFYGPFMEKTVAPGEAYSMAVTYYGDGTASEFAEALTLTTSAGEVTINILAQEQGFGFFSMDPTDVDAGVVPLGEQYETTFTIFNDGTGDLLYQIGQSLFILEDDEMLVESLARVNKKFDQPKQGSKAPIEFQELNDRNFDQIKDALSSVDRKKITLESPQIEDNDELLVWFDGLEDASNWELLSFGETEDYFDLIDVNAALDLGGDPNNVLMVGDFEDGYQNNTVAVAASPIFDLSRINIDGKGYVPQNFIFDYAASLEAGWDFFYVNVIADGARLRTAVITDDQLMNDGNQYQAMFDISDLTAYSEVEFWFIMASDDSFVDGWGAYFDNIGITATETPLSVSSAEGIIPVGGSAEISVGVNTSLVGEREVVVVTEVFNNSVNAFTEGVPHTLTMNIKQAHLELDNDYEFLGEVSEEVSTSFSATNMGSVPVDIYARTFLQRAVMGDGPMDGMMKSSEKPSFESTDKVARTPNWSATQSMLNRPYSARTALAKERAPKSGFGSKFMPSSQELDLLYYEDFEGYSDLPADWFVSSFNFGLGEEIMLDSAFIGGEVNSFLSAGVLTDGYILNFTATLAEGPIFSLAGLDESRVAFLQFDYAFFVEPGWDLASIWIGAVNDGMASYNLLGTSEDVFMNDGSINTALVNLNSFAGQDSLFFAYLVETDGSVMSVYSLVDEIAVFTDDAIAYATPGFVAGVEPGASVDYDVTILGDRLFPSEFRATTVLDYYSNETWLGDFTTHTADFVFPNAPPVAMNDTLYVMAGDAISMGFMMNAMMENDYDEDGHMLQMVDMTDPVRGTVRSLDIGDGDQMHEMYYVAPMNFEGMDIMTYMITDGGHMATADVVINVMEHPGFVTGSQQQYSMLEDEVLQMSTMRMAAGVGGMLDAFVWGASHDESVMVEHDAETHSIVFSADENYFGQATVTLYVGVDGMAEDSMDVTLVVAPVNDAPVAEFSINQDNNTLQLVDASSDLFDPNGGIVAWSWNFGDGVTSSEQNPTHVYTAVGEYKVTLTVTDNEGASASFEDEVSIDLIVSNETEMVPLEFKLSQNFPNPFNPSTNIQFSLPAQFEVTLEVFNLVGQKVATLANNKSMSAGEYTLSFDANLLSSGTYIYRIQATGADGTVKTDVKKMVLIK